MNVQERPIDDIIPYARNARVISDVAIDKVAASIKEFGWRQPIVVDDQNVIIAGHTRLLAAKKLGLKVVPVHVAVGLTPAQVKAYRLADNRTHDESRWDEQMLSIELAELSDFDIGLDLTGFDTDEITRLTSAGQDAAGFTDDDAVPELPMQPVTRLGDVWRLGRHQVLCGDCTEWEAVAKLLQKMPPELIFTDPPYGINLLGSKPSKCGGGGKVYEPIKGDDQDFDPTFIIELFGDVPMVLWGANYFSSKLPRGKWFVWDKQRPAGLDFSDCELAWSNLPGVKVKKYTVNINTETADRHHPTQKPVKLFCEMFDDIEAGKHIVDLFLGSGTTLLACEKTGRSCTGVELSEHYCDVIVRRWQEFTQQEAVHAGTGKTFAQLERERLEA